MSGHGERKQLLDMSQDETKYNIMWFSIPQRPLYFVLCVVAFIFNILRYDYLLPVYPRTQLHHYAGMMAYDSLKSFTTNTSVSLFTVKQNLGCVGHIKDNLLAEVTDPLLKDEYYEKFWKANMQQKFVDPAHKTVCSCIDELYYLSFLNSSSPTDEILDPTLESFITNMRVWWSTWWTTNQASYPQHADTLDWVMPGGKYSGMGFANIAQNYTDKAEDMLELESYCPYREEKALMDTCNDKDNLQKAGCLHIKPYMDTSTNKLNNNFKVECRRRRDAEILQTCVRHSVPLYVMKYDDTTANSVKSVLYGQNMLVLFIVMSLIRSTLDTIFVGKGGEKNMEAYFCVVLVVSALVIQIMSIGYIYADEKHLAGENDALMITLMILNLAIILSLFIIVYFSRIFSTQDMKKYGLEVHWNIWTVILFQVIIDIPLITGFTFLGSGLLMQYGVQDYLSIITTRGVFVVFGFIAHIAHVLKHLQYRFEESYKYKKDKEIEARKPGMHGTEGMNVIDIFNWITNTRLFASVVVVVGGFILFFAAREDSLNGSAIIELNQRQYMYLCILFVLINVGYEFYHETRAYYLLYINETLKEQKTSEVSENIYKIPRYGDGTSAKSLIIVIFLAISHFMAFSLYWKV